MIDYDEDWIFGLIPRCRGSVAVKSSVWGIAAALISLVLKAEGYVTWAEGFHSALGISGDVFEASQIWGSTTAILMVMLSMRTNRAISRFWEGTTLLHQMRGEWFDAVNCLVTFSASAKNDKPE